MPVGKEMTPQTADNESINRLFPVNMLFKAEVFNKFATTYPLRYAEADVQNFDGHVDRVRAVLRTYATTGIRLQMHLNTIYHACKVVNRAWRQYRRRRDIRLQCVLSAWRRSNELDMTLQMECIAHLYMERRRDQERRMLKYISDERNRNVQLRREEGDWLYFTDANDDTPLGDLKRAFQSTWERSARPPPPALSFSPQDVDLTQLSQKYMEVRDTYRLERVMLSLGKGGTATGGIRVRPSRLNAPIARVSYYYPSEEESSAGQRILVAADRVVWSSNPEIYYIAAMQRSGAIVPATKKKRNSDALLTESFETMKEGAGCGQVDRFKNNLVSAMRRKQVLQRTVSLDVPEEESKEEFSHIPQALKARTLSEAVVAGRVNPHYYDYTLERHEANRKLLVSLGVLRPREDDAGFLRELHNYDAKMMCSRDIIGNEVKDPQITKKVDHSPRKKTNICKKNLAEVVSSRTKRRPRKVVLSEKTESIVSEGVHRWEAMCELDRTVRADVEKACRLVGDVEGGGEGERSRAGSKRLSSLCSSFAAGERHPIEEASTAAEIAAAHRQAKHLRNRSLRASYLISRKPIKQQEMNQDHAVSLLWDLHNAAQKVEKTPIKKVLFSAAW